ncbi:uncharacterized protein LOC144869528 isoform X2 [Branchiostoma floridae x Branchiostoma japonicum]
MDWKIVAGILLFASLSLCESNVGETEQDNLTEGNTSECGATIYGGSGTISSPGFPLKYPNKKYCGWTIRAPPGRFIEATIGSLAIEMHGKECDYDSLSITVDGTRDYGPYCDANKPPDQRLVGTLFEITFVSDDTVGKEGFLLLYSTTKTPHETMENRAGCTSEILTAGSGVITTPNYPLKYPVKTNCTWTIQAEPDKVAFIQIETFDMEKSDNCSYDHMTITVDGNRTMGPYCNQIPPPLQSRMNGSKFEIYFRSDDSIVGIGFLLAYNSYPIEEELTTSDPGVADNKTDSPTEWVYTEAADTTQASPSHTPPTTSQPIIIDTFSDNVSVSAIDNQTVMTSPVATVDPTDGNVSTSNNGVQDKVHGPGSTNVGGVVAGITIPLLLIIGAAVAITRLFMKGQSPGQVLRRRRQKAQDDKTNQPSSDDQPDDTSDVQGAEGDQAPQPENTGGDDKGYGTVQEAAGAEAKPADDQAAAAAEEPATGEKSDTNEEEAAATGERSDDTATAVSEPTVTEEEAAEAPAEAPANPTYEEAAPVAAPAAPTYEEAAPVTAPADPTHEEAPVAPPADTATYEEAVPVRSQITVMPQEDDSGEATGPDPENPTPTAEPQPDTTDQPPEPSDTDGPSETAPPSDDSGPHDEQPGTSYASSQQDVLY